MGNGQRAKTQLRMAIFLLAAAACLIAPARADDMVVVTGVVPDKATKQRVMLRLRQLYGETGVVDEITVGHVTATPGWVDQLDAMLVPGMTQISNGELRVTADRARLSGIVPRPSDRQALLETLASRMDRGFRLDHELAVAQPGQARLDAELEGRVVEFRSASAELTAAGQQVLDAMMPTLRELSGREIEIVGHTDNRGTRAANLALSAARAESVKTYLAEAGITARRLISLGAGEQRPVASNDTPDGRARNRRIEFRLR